MDPAALTYYKRLELNPEDAEALSFLWDYHGGRAEFQELAKLVEQTAGHRNDPRSAADLFFRAGELWAKNVGRADKAVGNYKRAFELDPSQLPAMEAARAIYMQLGNAPAAAQILDRQLAATGDPAVRALLLREGAALRAQVGDYDGQIAYLDALARSAPDDWEVLRELASAYLSRAASPAAAEGDTGNAAHILAGLAQSMGMEHGLAFAEAALDASAGQETAYAIVHHAYLQAGRNEELIPRQIAFLQANPGSDFANEIRRNLANLYIGAGQIDDAITCLEPIAQDDPEVARPLAALYRQAGRVSDFAAVLEALVPHTDAAQRMQDLRDLAEVHGQQGDRGAMLQAMRDLLALDPADPEALALIEDDLRARSAYTDLREVLYGAVRAEHCPVEARLPRLREIAQVSAQRLDDPGTAIEAWRELLSYDPADAEALGSLEDLLGRAERWDELASVLDHRAQTGDDPQARRDALRRLAEVHREHRHDTHSEAATLAMLWEADPDDDLVAARLVETRMASADPEGAAAVMRARAERATDDTAATRWAELATHLARAGTVAGAVEAWQQVVATDPGNVPAWEALEGLLSSSGQHAALHEALTHRAAALPEGEDRARIHARAAEAAQAMGDPEAAVAEAERAVAMAPAAHDLAMVLLNLLELAGDRARLLAFANERAALLPDGPERMDLYRRAAHSVGQVDPQGAAAVWQALRASAKRAGFADDGESLDALLGLADVSGDHEGMVGLLAEAAAFAPTPEFKRDFLKRRAEVQSENLGRNDDAVTTLQDLLRDVDPRFAEGWALLGDLAAAAGRWALAAEALEKQVGLAADDDARAKLAGRLVALTEKEIKEPEAVLRALAVHHDADPGDFGVVQRLAELSEAAGRWTDAIRYHEELAETEGDDEELSKLTQHIAVLAEEKAGDARKAWAVLLPLAEGGDIAALEALSGVATRHDLHAELVPVLVSLAARVGDPEARAGLWREVAERRSRYLGDSPGALDAHVQSLLARPADLDALGAIDVLALEVRRPDLVKTAYRAAVEACTDPTAAHDLAMRGVGAVEGAGDAEGALDLSLLALGRAPADDDLLDAVVRLAPGLGRNDDVYLAFDKRRRAAQGDAERFAVTLRAALVAGAGLGDRETAFLYLEQAVSQAIGRKEPDEAMLDQVEATARDADQKRPEAGMLSGVVERYAQLAEDASEDNPRVAAVLLRRAGTVCDADLGLMEHALALYSRAVSLWPADVRGADKLEDAAQRARRTGEVVTLYQRVIDEAYDVAVARTYTGRRATLLGERLGRVDEAIDALQRLAEIAPRDLDVLHSLQHLLERNERWQQLLVAFEREFDAGGDRVATTRRIAATWETRLRNDFEARETWRRVLKLAPGDPEATEALARLEQRRTVRKLDDDLADAPPPLPAVPAGSAESDAATLEPLETGEFRQAPADPLHEGEVPALDLDPDRDLGGAPDAEQDPRAHLFEAVAGDTAPPAAREAPAETPRPPHPDEAGRTTGVVDLVHAPAEHPEPAAAPEHTGTFGPVATPLVHAAEEHPRSDLGEHLAGSVPGPIPGAAYEALEELEAADALEAEAEDAELLDEVEAVADEDDAPSLDSLAALTSTQHVPALSSRPPPPPRSSIPPPLPPFPRK